MSKVPISSAKMGISGVIWLVSGIVLALWIIACAVFTAMFGMFIVSILLLLIGGWLSISLFKRARKKIVGRCTRCQKRMVVYKYEYAAMCKRCGES